MNAASATPAIPRRFIVPSHSDPTRSYVVAITPAGAFCPCRGHANCGICWHTRVAVERMAEVSWATFALCCRCGETFSCTGNEPSWRDRAYCPSCR